MNRRNFVTGMVAMALVPKFGGATEYVSPTGGSVQYGFTNGIDTISFWYNDSVDFVDPVWFDLMSLEKGDNGAEKAKAVKDGNRISPWPWAGASRVWLAEQRGVEAYYIWKAEQVGSTFITISNKAERDMQEIAEDVKPLMEAIGLQSAIGPFAAPEGWYDAEIDPNCVLPHTDPNHDLHLTSPFKGPFSKA